MKRASNPTAAYAFVQAAFWMNFCVAICFASVYLQGLGYSNMQLGWVSAAGNLLGALLGPCLAALMDRSGRFTARRLVLPVLLGQALALGVLAALNRKGPVTSVCFAAYMACSVAANSLNLKRYADAAQLGVAVDYGMARGMGSLLFVGCSFGLGALISGLSVAVVPWVGLGLCALQGLSHLLLSRVIPNEAAAAQQTQEKARSLPVFARENGCFMVLLAGTALLFFAHNVVCNFLINVVRNVGGGTGEMGFLNGFMAVTEIPVMLLYTRLFGRRSPARLLALSFVAFSLKAAAFALSGSIPALTASLLLQAPSFALYTAAIVPYVEQHIPYRDAAKAQSLAYSMTTVGAVLAALGGGWLYDHTTVGVTLWVALGVSALGTLIAILGLGTRKSAEMAG